MKPAYQSWTREALDHLYKSCGGPALSKALAIVRREDIACEIVHDVFVKLANAKLEFADIKAAYAWIYVAVHNASINHLRSAVHRYEGSTSPEVLDGLCWETRNPELESIDRELIRKLCQSLSERELAVCLYYVMDGMTQDEIAAVLGISARTVARDFERVRDILAAIDSGKGKPWEKAS